MNNLPSTPNVGTAIKPRRQGVPWRLLTALAVAAVMGTFAATVGAKDFLKIRARDECDPATFGPRCFGSNTGEVTLQEFSDALPNGGHEDWKFNPGISGNHVDAGGMIQVRSEGGVGHTFTRVAEFGGGRVTALNVAVGNAPTVPECVPPSTPGANSVSIPVLQDSVQNFAAGTSPLFPPGSHRYQCCIHPWMRTTITVRGRH